MAKTDRKQMPSGMGFYGIGIEFAAIVGVLTWLGWKYDARYHSSPWGVLVGVTVGLSTGMYILIRGALATSRNAGKSSERGRHGEHSSHEP
jgi:F0F1-type ATP synthase assembly protein I